MKKLFTLAAVVTLMLTGCAKNETVTVSDNNVLTFRAFSLPVFSKAAMATDQKFMVYAKFSDLGDGSDYRDFWEGAKEVSYNTTGSYWTTTTGSYYWPKTGAISFWAYYPTTVTPSDFDTTNGVKFEGLDAAAAGELMLADPALLKTTNNVPIVFKHAGSQVSFKFSNNQGSAVTPTPSVTFGLTITNISISNVQTTGDYASTGWTNESVTGLLDYGTDTNVTNNTLTEAVKWNVIPQDKDVAGQKVITITYTVTDNNGFTYNGTYTVNATDWERNKRYNYNITFDFTTSDPNDPFKTDDLLIKFDPTVEDWTEVPTNVLL